MRWRGRISFYDLVFCAWFPQTTWAEICYLGVWIYLIMDLLRNRQTLSRCFQLLIAIRRLIRGHSKRMLQVQLLSIFAFNCPYIQRLFMLINGERWRLNRHGRPPSMPLSRWIVQQLKILYLSLRSLPSYLYLLGTIGCINTYETLGH